jgi:acyl-coenzyme A synthetase/AMP-(fatty) acid ligase
LKYADAGQVNDIPVGGQERTSQPHHWDEDDEAIVFFTSGATGAPKGFCVPARSFLANNTLRQLPWMNVLHWSSISHSQSSYHVLALSYGKRVVCIANDDWMDNQRMSAIVRQWDAEVVFCTPSYAHIIAQTDQPWLNQVKPYLYGEVASLELVKSLNATNLYGQTEGPDAWMAFQTPPVDWTPEPSYKMAIYECGSDLEIKKTGVVGRLVVGSSKWLVSKKIDSSHPISLPFDTGDLATWTSVNPPRFQLLGRSNRMHKIRGFRVELGEVEAELIASGSDAATVIVKGEKLIAYVTPQNLDVNDLREKIANLLPHYMIPSVIRSINAFPLMTNGKVDTASLPEVEIETGYVAPTTPEEKAMCKLWEELLDVERVGIHDDWSALGGHSLAAMQLAQRTGYTAPVILTNPTVMQLLTAKASADSLDHDPNSRVPWVSSFFTHRGSSQSRMSIRAWKRLAIWRVRWSIMRMTRYGINLFNGLILTSGPFDIGTAN